MAIDQLNLIKNQTQAVLRNKAAGSVAKLRSETSLVAQASRLTGRMTQKANQVEKEFTQRRKTRRPPSVETDPELSRQTAKPAPDGYVRRSPEQPIRVAADYHRKILRKGIGGVIAVICVAVLVWLLLRSNLLAH